VPQKPTKRLSTAARLLDKLVRTELLTREELATQLVTDAATLDRYLSGDAEMPLERQLVLAALLIERVPSMARAGRRLRGQVEAAIAYHAGETERHANDSRRINYW
jgi:hypothetical protein